MKILISELIEDEPYEFKVTDYTTKIIGRYTTKSGHYHKCFVVERGDGKKWFYELYRVEWYKQLSFNHMIKVLMKKEEK